LPADVHNLLDKAQKYKARVTGSRFQKWLDTEKAGNLQAMVEAENYIKWESRLNAQELAKAREKRESAHRARIAQIIEHCEVLHF
jgi:rubrerythrin